MQVSTQFTSTQELMHFMLGTDEKMINPLCLCFKAHPHATQHYFNIQNCWKSKKKSCVAFSNQQSKKKIK